MFRCLSFPRLALAGEGPTTRPHPALCGPCSLIDLAGAAPPRVGPLLPRPLGPRSPPATRGSPARSQGHGGSWQPLLGTRSRHARPSELARAPWSALVPHVESPSATRSPWGPACLRVMWDHHLSALSCDYQGKGPRKLLPLVSQSTRCPKAFLCLDFMRLVTPSHGGAPLSGKGIPILHTNTQTSCNTRKED